MSQFLLQFQEHLKPFGWQQSSMLVGLSGGIDSMALCAMLHQSDIHIEAAHCNFGLRGTESDGDEEMVRKWTTENGIKLHVKAFDVPQLLEREGGNLEEIARRLRYQWFEEIREQNNLDFIAVAHHRQDNIETLLINFFKGTGIAGLHGILPQRGRIIRPLLSFSKEELREFLISQNIHWREDSSNQGDDYLRNKIRHHLWPEILKVFPSAETNLLNNINRFQEVEKVYEETIDRYRNQLVEKKGEDIYLSVLKLKKLSHSRTILYELLKPYGFGNAMLGDIENLLDAETGKWLASKDFRILKNRNHLVITSLKPNESAIQVVNYPEGGKAELQTISGIFSMCLTDKESINLTCNNKQEEHVILSLDDFPLILRSLKEGDYFYPIGMNKKKKKVGKFLRDLKIAPHEKEKVKVLESRKRIVWVLGQRMDERFKVKENTTDNIWKLSWQLFKK